MRTLHIFSFKSLILVLFMACFSGNAHSVSSRIKDIVSIEGIRDNMLIGYGIVVGLGGTGDNLSNAKFTEKGLIEFLGRMGINMKGANLKTKNIAAVTVTATLPPFARQGSKIDILVSTIGDAKSLQGGLLLATPLLGADGKAYAVAQGTISIGGFSAASGGTTVNKGVPTNGFISNGGIIEKEIDFALDSMDQVKLSLNNPDISTAMQIASNINRRMGEKVAKAIDPATVQLVIPNDEKGEVLSFLAKIENLVVTPDMYAKIVIDEASGTIVMGENVRISPVAISQGNLTITITENKNVSQPNPFAPEGAETVVIEEPDIAVDEELGMKMHVVGGGSTLQEVVDGLNALAVSPRDMITILQNIKAAGALQATISTR
jgi:flagellar P-ring protein FlgI